MVSIVDVGKTYRIEEQQLEVPHNTALEKNNFVSPAYTVMLFVRV